MKILSAAKNPPVLRPAPFDKGGHWGICPVAPKALQLISSFEA